MGEAGEGEVRGEGGGPGGRGGCGGGGGAGVGCSAEDWEGMRGKGGEMRLSLLLLFFFFNCENGHSQQQLKKINKTKLKTKANLLVQIINIYLSYFLTGSKWLASHTSQNRRFGALQDGEYPSNLPSR